METSSTFQYLYSNISLYQFHQDWIPFAIALIGGVFLMISLFYLLRFFYLVSKGREEETAFQRKKKLLDNLVIMKDIQTELEKEIEQAILKAAFHS